MSKPVIVKIIGASTCATPHDGRYLVSWNPNTRYGELHCVSTDDPGAAKVFDDVRDAMNDWHTVSKVEPNRPSDGRPNRPLSALTITFEDAPP